MRAESGKLDVPYTTEFFVGQRQAGQSADALLSLTHGHLLYDERGLPG